MVIWGITCYFSLKCTSLTCKIVYYYIVEADFVPDYLEEGYPGEPSTETTPLADLTNVLVPETCGVPIPVKVGTRKLHPCPLCETRTKVVKRHCVKFHFPRCLDVPRIEERLLFQVKQNELDFFCKELDLVDVHALCTFINERGLNTRQEHSLESNITQVASNLSRCMPTVSSKELAELLHWRTVCNLLLQLPPDRRVIFRDVEPHRNSRVTGVKIADAHMHPEVMLREFSLSSLAQIEKKVKCTSSFSHLIGNLCFPSLWEKGFAISDSRLRFSVGYHPRFAAEFESYHYSEMNELLKREKVVGFGEVGLDYTNPEASWGVQRVVLRTIVPLAVIHGKTVVIHCREKSEWENKAGRDCRSILQKILPRYHPIHVHCFVGGIEEAWDWVRVFPNCRFGISPKFTHGCPTAEVVRVFPDRLVLESDAPYLGCKGRRGHHGLVPGIAQEIATVLRLSYEDVVFKTTNNTQKLYKL